MPRRGDPWGCSSSAAPAGRPCSITRPRSPASASSPNCCFLRESRVESGHDEAKPNPAQPVRRLRGARPQSVRALLLPLLRSRAFLIVCLLSLGCTIIRETFNIWTPVYLRDYLGYTMSNAAAHERDISRGRRRVRARHRLAQRPAGRQRPVLSVPRSGRHGGGAPAADVHALRAPSAALLPLLTIGTIAFCLLGPYSYLGGAFALDFGGKQASAVSSGIIDGVGYLGAVVAGDSVARVSVAFGWRGVFIALAAVSAAGGDRRRPTCTSSSATASARSPECRQLP